MPAGGPESCWVSRSMSRNGSKRMTIAIAQWSADPQDDPVRLYLDSNVFDHVLDPREGCLVHGLQCQAQIAITVAVQLGYDPFA